MTNENSKRGFLDFYEENSIAPVRQDIGDYQQHNNRRENLLKLLGIPPALVKDRSLLEFGPGVGQNSTYFALLDPGSMDLVEANTESIMALKINFAELGIENHSLHETYFQDFFSNRKFEIVWAENCIPHQNDPSKILKMIAKNVDDGGVLVFTCLSGLSYLSEICRKAVYVNSAASKVEGIENKLDLLRPYFKPHLQSLEHITRLHDDWIIDNVIHPFSSADLFSFEEAIQAISTDFEFYRSTPDFSKSWLWYKSLNGPDTAPKEMHLQNYFSSNISLLDRNIPPYTHDQAVGREFESLGRRIWEDLKRFEVRGQHAETDLITNLELLQKMIATFSSDTACAIGDAIKAIVSGSLEPKDDAFSAWWGRGNMHCSFIKRREKPLT